MPTRNQKVIQILKARRNSFLKMWSNVFAFFSSEEPFFIKNSIGLNMTENPAEQANFSRFKARNSLISLYWWLKWAINAYWQQQQPFNGKMSVDNHAESKWTKVIYLWLYIWGDSAIFPFCWAFSQLVEIDCKFPAIAFKKVFFEFNFSFIIFLICNWRQAYFPESCRHAPVCMCTFSTESNFLIIHWSLMHTLRLLYHYVVKWPCNAKFPPAFLLTLPEQISWLGITS